MSTTQHFGHWSGVFAAVYDRMMAAGEQAGMRERRRRVLADARGKTLEIGAGTGLNLPLYPAHVTELTITEPSPPMHRRLQERARGERPGANVVCAGAQDLPFPDATFDTAVSTLVLCTVPDQPAAIAEVQRVLKPDGQLLFVEHVAGHDPGTERWQRRLQRPWKAFADGCDCHRHTLDALQRAFPHVEHRDEDWAKSVPLVKQLIVGTAHVTAPTGQHLS